MSIFKGTTEPKKIYYGEPIIVSDMQGPCPDGFHIPTRDEWTSLKNACTSLGIWSTGSDLISYLKMPVSGIRDANTTIYYQGERGTYWTSIRYNANTAYYFNFWTTRTGNTTNQGLSAGSMIRPFKNTSVTPDNTRTVLKQGSGTSGVYRNSDLGLISISSDGSTRITIADKNVGATSTDTSSTSSYGYYFQFGNNYGFPNSGSVTTSSTQVNASTYGPGNYYESSTWVTSDPRESSGNSNLRGGVTQGTSEKKVEPKKIYMWVEVQPIATPGIYHNSDLGLISLSSDGTNWITIADKNLGATTVWNSGDTLSEANCGKFYQRGNNYGFSWTGSVTTSSTRVNAGDYGPGNYYSSSTFITVSGVWDNSHNGNLWGGVTGTVEAMQGPCSAGFHIPSYNERLSIKSIWTSLGGGSSDGINFGIKLKLPFAGRRSYSNSNRGGDGYNGKYWSSLSFDKSPRYVYFASIADSSISIQDTYDYQTWGQSIRPFANTATQPDDSWTRLDA